MGGEVRDNVRRGVKGGVKDTVECGGCGKVCGGVLRCVGVVKKC